MDDTRRLGLWDCLEWKRPQRNQQSTLFRRSTLELLALASVSMEEATSWFIRKWLSFDPRTTDDLDEPLIHELVFVRNLARSGLSTEQVEAMLSQLERPYRYNPLRTAFSFATGWVECPALASIEDIIEQNVDQWVGERARLGEHDRLRSLVVRIRESIARSGLSGGS